MSNEETIRKKLGIIMSNEETTRKKIEKQAEDKAVKQLKKAHLPIKTYKDIIKIIKDGIKNNLSDDEIAKQIDDKYCNKEEKKEFIDYDDFLNR